MTQPINNFAVGDKLRLITQRSWDARLEENVLPVIIVNSEDLAIEAQTAGLLKPTSLQTPKTITLGKAASASITAGTGLKLYDVTPGKIFYLTSLSVSSSTGGTSELRDGTTVAGTLKLGIGSAGTNIPFIKTYNTPIPFSTAVFMDVNATGTAAYSIEGWEE